MLTSAQHAIALGAAKIMKRFVRNKKKASEVKKSPQKNNLGNGPVEVIQERGAHEEEEDPTQVDVTGVNFLD